MVILVLEIGLEQAKARYLKAAKFVSSVLRQPLRNEQGINSQLICYNTVPDYPLYCQAIEAHMTISPYDQAFTPTFSGHETFALRGSWLKKAYDLLATTPDLFSLPDAFVQLGVGKNMAQSIRFWGRACGVFERDGNTVRATEFGRRLLADDGWDPFLVTPAARWLLHWQVAARPEAAFTWFYTFNILRGGEFTTRHLADQIQAYAAERDWNVPSDTTITRDIECLLHCYSRPTGKHEQRVAEDSLLCPLAELGLVQPTSHQHTYRVLSGEQLDIPDLLVAWSVGMFMRFAQRQTSAFTDLAYAPRSPGRVFRFDEDGLLERLARLEDVTDDIARYTEQAGIRHVVWPNVLAFDPWALLDGVFANEENE